MTKLLTYIFIFLFTFTSSVNACYYVGDNTETGLGVLGHETGHAVYGDNEDTANYFGSRFTDAYTDGLWINGVDFKLGSWSSGDTNPLYIAQNNVDYAKVENKEDCGLFCLSVLGVGAIISGIGAYKGGEAKAIVDYGYLGNNEYMRPDGTRILGEDLKTNLKIYGTMDIGGGLLMSAAPFVKGNYAGKSANIVDSKKISNVAKKVKEFLGNDVKVIKNKSGDSIFMSKDGDLVKKIRFDLKNPHPHKNPHVHIEIFKNNKDFYKSGQIYLKDIPKY